MTSREEILADFQACTGIEDVEVAIGQLEEAGWVLLDAVNRVLPTTSPAPGPGSAPPPPQLPAPREETSPPPPAVPPPVPPRTEDSDMQEVPPATATTSSTSSTSSSSTSSARRSRWEREGAEAAANPFMAFQSGSRSTGVPTSLASDLYGPSTSSFAPRFRMLDFYVQHGDNQFHLKVPDNEDVKSLKMLIQNETGCPPCQQSIRGFKGSSSLPPTDRRRLSELNLPKENFLVLTTPEEYGRGGVANGEEGARDEVTDDFRLVITNETNNESYTLNFRPTTTVLSIKLDIATLTDIPVSKQAWTGWPDGSSDELSLAQIGVEHEHHLTVGKKPPEPPRSMPVLDPGSSSSGGSQRESRQNSQSRRDNDQGDSDDEFEDAASEVVMDDDDFFAGGGGMGGGGPGSSSSGIDTVGRRLQPLIPDDYGDEVMASLKFGEEFAHRYGTPHPNFFPGSLSDAIKESCQQTAKKRKMLAIYLHHDSSVLSNVFCTQALCAESVSAFLDENFVTFGWDVTHHANKQRCIQMMTEHFGSIAAATVRNLDIERFPLLALVYKLRGTIEIFQIIHGNVTLDELMSQLLSASETYTAQIAVEIQEEDEREARDRVKREQDLAFEMAQLADKEKDEQRKREEAEKREEERREEEKRAREERQRKREEEEKEAKRKMIASRLPSEPPSSVPHARIRFRSVERGQFERRFLPGDPLAVLFDFLASEGFPQEEHKVLSSWPRRDLTTLDPSRTLEELKLFPQETLTLEEK